MGWFPWNVTLVLSSTVAFCCYYIFLRIYARSNNTNLARRKTFSLVYSANRIFNTFYGDLEHQNTKLSVECSSKKCRRTRLLPHKVSAMLPNVPILSAVINLTRFVESICVLVHQGKAMSPEIYRLLTMWFFVCIFFSVNVPCLLSVALVLSTHFFWLLLRFLAAIAVEVNWAKIAFSINSLPSLFQELLFL